MAVKWRGSAVEKFLFVEWLCWRARTLDSRSGCCCLVCPPFVSCMEQILSQRIESLVQRVVPARLFSGLAEIANFAEFGTKKIKLKSSNFENFKCLHIYRGT